MEPLRYDCGILSKLSGKWLVIPEKLPFRTIELHPEDVKIINDGYCLTVPNGLKVEFEVVCKKVYISKSIIDEIFYARILYDNN